ncbi:MAG: hypothetical protein WCT85_00970 [Parachlamydiales bacterium]
MSPIIEIRPDIDAGEKPFEKKVIKISPTSAKEIAIELGLQKVFSGARPAETEENIQELQNALLLATKGL